jgi:hypothetical protein
MRRPGLHDIADQMTQSTSNREKNLRGVQSGRVVTRTEGWERHTSGGKSRGDIDVAKKSVL